MANDNDKTLSIGALDPQGMLDLADRLHEQNNDIDFAVSRTTAQEAIDVLRAAAKIIETNAAEIRRLDYALAKERSDHQALRSRLARRFVLTADGYGVAVASYYANERTIAERGRENSIADTAYIAAASPDVVLALLDENEKLRTRQQELLATIVRVTNETPYPDELKGWESQRRALLAEVGTLKAEVIGLKRELLAISRDRDNFMGAMMTAATERDEARQQLAEAKAECEQLRDSHNRLLPPGKLVVELYRLQEQLAAVAAARDATADLASAAYAPEHEDVHARIAELRRVGGGK